VTREQLQALIDRNAALVAEVRVLRAQVHVLRALRDLLERAA
jgi:cell division protein FtsB